MTTSLLTSKIIYLAEERERRQTARSVAQVSTDGHERRRQFRRQSDERLFLQIVQSDDNDLVGTTISCHTMDASATGLKVACDQHIPVGCVIDLWVDDRTRPGKFFLSSVVRWIRASQAGHFHIGIELLEGAATDIDEWRERQG